MIWVEIYQNGKKIDEGEFVAGKHWREEYPYQSVTITDEINKNERTYEVENDINFKEYNSDFELNYDSETKIDYEEQRRNKYLSELIECPTCHEKAKRIDIRLISDRYGIPYKNCCPLCIEDTEREIGVWEYDYLDAGEQLEEDY